MTPKYKEDINKLKKLSQTISKNANLDADMWTVGIQHNVNSSTMYNGKLYKSKTRYDQLSIVYNDECLDIEILEYNKNTYELYWLEVKNEKCKGVGTEILNHILDACEEHNVNLTLVPVPLEAKTWKENDSLTKRLLNWYKSFGFIQIDNRTPQLTYGV
tara:strand:- start:566 stop:1042 length:477 start_codon:yes stop_codon:yes gene_type:complete